MHVLYYVACVFFDWAVLQSYNSLVIYFPALPVVHNFVETREICDRRSRLGTSALRRERYPFLALLLLPYLYETVNTGACLTIAHCSFTYAFCLSRDNTHTLLCKTSAQVKKSKVNRGLLDCFFVH